jgi:hypothetical protein
MNIDSDALGAMQTQAFEIMRQRRVTRHLDDAFDTEANKWIVVSSRKEREHHRVTSSSEGSTVLRCSCPEQVSDFMCAHRYAVLLFEGSELVESVISSAPRSTHSLPRVGLLTSQDVENRGRKNHQVRPTPSARRARSPPPSSSVPSSDLLPVLPGSTSPTISISVSNEPAPTVVATQAPSHAVGMPAAVPSEQPRAPQSLENDAATRQQASAPLVMRSLMRQWREQVEAASDINAPRPQRAKRKRQHSDCVDPDDIE